MVACSDKAAVNTTLTTVKTQNHLRFIYTNIQKCTISMSTAGQAIDLWLKKEKLGIVLNGKPITELQGVSCHMGSHSVTCHPTQVNTPRHNPSQTGRYSIYLPAMPPSNPGIVNSRFRAGKIHSVFHISCTINTSCSNSN